MEITLNQILGKLGIDKSDLSKLLGAYPDVKNELEGLLQNTEEANDAPVKTVRRSRIKSHPDFDEIIAQVQHKATTVNQAASLLNCSPTWVYNYLKKPSHSVELKFYNKIDSIDNPNDNKYDLTATLNGKFNDNNVNIVAHIDNIA